MVIVIKLATGIIYVCIYISLRVIFTANIAKLLILLNLIGPIKVNETRLVLWPTEPAQEV